MGSRLSEVQRSQSRKESDDSRLYLGSRSDLFRWRIHGGDDQPINPVDSAWSSCVLHGGMVAGEVAVDDSLDGDLAAEAVISFYVEYGK